MIKDPAKLLMTIADSWRNPRYALRQRAIDYASKEFGLSQLSFEITLDWIFDQWEEWIINNRFESPFEKHRFAVQVLSGNTPAMIAQGFFQGALLNKPHCIKLPREQTLFAHLLYESFVEHSPYYSELFDLDNGQDLSVFHVKLSEADLVIAYGHDETMTKLQSLLSPEATFIAHQHAESIAIVFNDAANGSTLEKFADDMLSYDQRGCLSPRMICIEEGGEWDPAQCAKIFAEEILPQAAKKWPRGRLFPGEASEIFHQRIVHRFHGKVYSGESWTVCYNETPSWSEISLPRFMLFKPLEVMLETLKTRPLIQIGFAGSHTKMMDLNETLDARLCHLGQMQKQLMVF